MDSVLIVGECPSPDLDIDIDEPLCSHTRSGQRLAEVLRVNLDEYQAEFYRTNLLNVRGSGPWRKWHRDRARAGAARVEEWEEYLNVVLLGKNVAEAFGFDYVPLTRRWKSKVTFYLLPHPSPLNRWWNDRIHRWAAKGFLAQIER